jgi:broad specificity phosphatase PhoE
MREVKKVALLYISHPQVTIDPEVPVERWGLSHIGAARARAFAARHVFPQGTVFISSTEQKAVDLAQILAASCEGRVKALPAFGENDRSATGYLPQEAFEAHANAFFGAPDVSVAGWETARDAQKRIVGAVHEVLETFAGEESFGEKSVVFTGHGGVGTLLKCYLGDRDVSRQEDQGVLGHACGGNLYAFDLAPNRLLCEWTPIEDWKGF